MNKKLYIKPEIVRVVLDYTISIQMQSRGPHDPPGGGRGRGRGARRGLGDSPDTPFQSPFGDKPFG